LSNRENNISELLRLIRKVLAVGLFILVALWTVTQYIAAHYSYDPILGTPFYGTLYEPYLAVSWSIEIIGTNTSLIVVSWLVGLLVASLLTATLVALYLFTSHSKKRKHGHGSARWASRNDIKNAGLVDALTNKTSLIVGGFENTKSKVVEYLIHTGPESVLAYAPSRSGKGVGLVIPNLLSYEESAFVLDVKGELWSSTAGYRRDGLGQHVLFHNPSSLEPGNAQFNVLDEVRTTEPTAVKDTQLIAEYLIPSSKRGGGSESSASENEHFETSARSLLVGVILHELNKANSFNNSLAAAKKAFNDGCGNDYVKTLLPQENVYDVLTEEELEGEPATGKLEDDIDEIDFPKKKVVNVNSVLATVTDPDLEFRDYLSEMQEYEDDECSYVSVIRQIATEMQNREDREFSSVLSSMTNPLSIFRDPILANATARSDFHLIDLIENEKPVSLYMIVSPSEGERLRNYFGMMVNILCRKLTEKLPNEEYKRHKLLLMLDEFSKLPPLPIVQESLDHFAGYGIKAYIVAQDVQTLTRLYGRNETIQSNCKVRIAFTPNKLETAEMLSKMVGSETVQERTQNRSRKAVSMIDSSVSEAEGLHGRPLITVDEIMQLKVPVLDVNEKMIQPGASLVFVTGCRPIKGIQTPFFMDEEMKRRSEYKAPSASDDINRDDSLDKEQMAVKGNDVTEDVLPIFGLAGS